MSYFSFFQSYSYDKLAPCDVPMSVVSLEFPPPLDLFPPPMNPEVKNFSFVFSNAFLVHSFIPDAHFTESRVLFPCKYTQSLLEGSNLTLGSSSADNLSRPPLTVYDIYM